MTDFRTACEGTALNAVLQERARQLGIKGHSRKSDNAKPLTALLGQCFKQLVVAKRYAEPGEHTSLTSLRHWAARAGACCLALIDRIDFEIERRQPVSRDEENARRQQVSREEEKTA